jgi:hypothetical protein
MDSARRTLVLVLIFSGLHLVFTNSPVRADQASCEQIKTECKSAGFVLGGGARDGLLLDCFNPIVQGTARPKAASIPLPKINPQLVNACRAGNDSAPVAEPASAALVPAADGQTIYDPNLNVTWIADANLAATQTFGVSNINHDGSMDYATAVRWVEAMNALDHGAGYLGHNTWQLPTAPTEDNSCARTGRHGESFGFHCSGSALGSLYYGSLGLREPDTAVRIPTNTVGRFNDFQPYLYWSGSPPADPKQGFVSFSFNTGFQGANVTLNYLYVLPMIKGKLPGTPPATGKGLEVNPGGQTVYDPVAQVTWLADANLAAKQTFGVAGINPDGSMEHSVAVQWVAAMNKADQGRGYLGQTNWQLPETVSPDPSCSIGENGTTGFDCADSPMGELFYKQLGLRRGQSVVAAPDVKVGPFHNIQPYLYWACEAKTAISACQTNGPADGFEWNFSFGNGFEGTNLLANNLYVIVYYPGSSTRTPAP